MPPGIRRRLDQAEAEPTGTFIGPRSLDDVDPACRGGLFDLDANVIIIRFDAQVDELSAIVHRRMAHGVAHQLGDGEPRVIRATVERGRWDRVVQGGTGELPGCVIHGEYQVPA